MSRKELLSELRPIFHPRTVALVGASSGSGKVGRMFMERFVEAGFEKLYPINPREKEILGIEAYASVGETPEPIDLSIAAIVAPAMYADVIRILDQDENVDMLLVIGTGGAEFTERIREAAGRVIKPLVTVLINPVGALLPDYEVLMGSGIPVYPDPIRAAIALAKLADYAGFRARCD